MAESVIFKYDSFEDKLVEAAIDEAQAAPKKPQTDLLWCEKEWGEECEKVRVKVMQILDDISSDSQLAGIVKPTLKTLKTYAHVIEISPGKGDVLRSLTFPGDYVTIVPLVYKGLPRWAQPPSSNQKVSLEWKKRSLLFLRSGTKLVCSTEGGGLFIVMGVEHEAQ